MTQFLANLVESRDNAVIVHTQCMTKLAAENRAVVAARRQLHDETERHISIVRRIDGEIALFKEVVAIYRAQVLNAAEAVRARMNDYSSEGNFNRTSNYTSRETTRYNSLEGHVRQSLEHQA